MRVRSAVFVLCAASALATAAFRGRDCHDAADGVEDPRERRSHHDRRDVADRARAFTRRFAPVRARSGSPQAARSASSMRRRCARFAASRWPARTARRCGTSAVTACGWLRRGRSTRRSRTSIRTPERWTASSRFRRRFIRSRSRATAAGGSPLPATSRTAFRSSIPPRGFRPKRSTPGGIPPPWCTAATAASTSPSGVSELRGRVRRNRTLAHPRRTASGRARGR